MRVNLSLPEVAKFGTLPTLEDGYSVNPWTPWGYTTPNPGGLDYHTLREMSVDNTKKQIKTLQVRNPNAPESRSPLVIAAVMPVETQRKKRGVPAGDMRFQKPKEDDLEACNMAHLEKRTQTNANVTLRMWQAMMTQLYGDNADELNEENACERFVAFTNGVHDVLPNQTLKTFMVL